MCLTRRFTNDHQPIPQRRYIVVDKKCTDAHKRKYISKVTKHPNMSIHPRTKMRQNKITVAFFANKLYNLDNGEAK